MKNIKEIYWKYNSSKEYDIYYEGGAKSVYNNLYKNKTITRDQTILKNTIFKLAKLKDEITILDFGCGNGRYFELFAKIANELNAKNIKINLICYDPSITALNNYKELIINKEFEYIDGVSQVFSKENLNIKFVINTDYEIERLKIDIKDVDVTFAMFGVVNHIQGKEKRIETLKFLYDLTSEILIISLAGPRILKENQKIFKFLKKEKLNFQFNDKLLKLEDGDIIYSRNYKDKQVKNFYHIYSSIDEIIDDIKHTNIIKRYNIAINKIMNETRLIKSEFISKIDEFISVIASYCLPNFLIDITVGYYLVTIEKDKK